MKKEFLNLLKITFQKRNTSGCVRLYSKGGYIWAHRVGNNLDLHLRLEPTNRSFDVCVSGGEAKVLAELEANLVIKFDGDLFINGHRATASEEIPFDYLPVDEAKAIKNETTLFDIEAGTVLLIDRAAPYLGADVGRPLFWNVYLDREHVTATNTHFLYTAPHGLEQVALPVYIPKELVSFLTPGALRVYDIGTKANPRRSYEFHAVDRVGFWRLPLSTYPEYMRLFDTIDVSQSVKCESGAAFLLKVNQLIKLDKLAGDGTIDLDAALQIGDSLRSVDGEYLRIILKTIGKRPFTLYYGEGKNKPVIFETADEQIILTPIRRN